MRTIIRTILGIGLIVMLPFGLSGQKKASVFLDTLDNALDLSRWLQNAYGFVPIVSLITEPAIGFGGAGGLIFIHRDRKAPPEQAAGPPSLSVLGGMYTSNGSWAVAGGHIGYWKKDRIRYRGGGGYGSINLTYYRPEEKIGPSEIDFNIRGWGLTQQLAFRLGRSRLFAGGEYSFLNATVKFQLPGRPEELPDRGKNTRVAGLGVVMSYDNRDNIFTPNRGMRILATAKHYDTFLGGSVTFQQVESIGLFYFSHGRRLVSGIRLDGRFSFGKAPFYVLPYIQLRGIPAMRYLGQQTLLLEIEERWNVSRRWSLVGFGGIGKAWLRFDGINFSGSDNAYNFGTGLRYLLARLYNLYVGFDVARGPEQWTFYIQFGSDWSRF